jgi:hypothetical protein
MPKPRTQYRSISVPGKSPSTDVSCRAHCAALPVLRAALRGALSHTHSGGPHGPFARRTYGGPWWFERSRSRRQCQTEAEGSTQASAATPAAVSASTSLPRGAAAAMSASAAAAPPTTIEVVCTRLARYWVAECSEGQRTPAPLAPRQASVLVPLVSAAAAMATNHIVGSNGVGGCEDVHVLLCTRSANLSSHAGEVCLPAGDHNASVPPLLVT